ncbi:hypothetical protein OROGR_003296 [Orobanche gracilis]
MAKKAQASLKPGLSMPRVVSRLETGGSCLHRSLCLDISQNSAVSSGDGFVLLGSYAEEISCSKLSVQWRSENRVSVSGSEKFTPRFPLGKLFRELVAWGEASMIDAERVLFGEALQDPANRRFILLSDSVILTDLSVFIYSVRCVPLYNFSYIYKYLMDSPRSFVDSFFDKKDARYYPKMSPVIHRNKWRKGSQWVTLIRRHAEVVVDDETVFPIFRKYCKRRSPIDPSSGRKNLANCMQKLQKQRNCIPDEHYVQTLLAMNDLEPELERRTDINHVYHKTEFRTEWCSNNSTSVPCFLFARKFSQGAATRLLSEGSIW